MKKAFDFERVLDFWRFVRTGRRELEQRNQQLEQRNQQLEQVKEQLKQTRERLEWRKQREERAQEQLKQTRERLEWRKQREERATGELEQTRERLEWRKQREERAQEQLKQTRGWLEQAKQREQQAKGRLEQTRKQLKQARQQLKQVDREYLLRRMPKRSVCAEIGVHEGEFSKQILDAVEPRRLHLIDPWSHQDRYEKAWFGGLAPDKQATMDERYRKVRERFAEETDADQVQIHRNPSSAASDDFEDYYFDWVYIDGNHLYEFAKQDLELYYPKVKADGYIAGDDYGVEGWWENGVQKAVDEFVSQRPDLTLEVKGDQFIIKKAYAPAPEPPSRT